METVQKVFWLDSKVVDDIKNFTGQKKSYSMVIRWFLTNHYRPAKDVSVFEKYEDIEKNSFNVRLDVQAEMKLKRLLSSYTDCGHEIDPSLLMCHVIEELLLFLKKSPVQKKGVLKHSQLHVKEGTLRAIEEILHVKRERNLALELFYLYEYEPPESIELIHKRKEKHEVLVYGFDENTHKSMENLALEYRQKGLKEVSKSDVLRDVVYKFVQLKKQGYKEEVAEKLEKAISEHEQVYGVENTVEKLKGYIQGK